MSLAVKNWKPDRPHTVTLQIYNQGLDCAAIGPVWQWQQVVSLDLSYNELRVLPEDIDLPKLRDLKISNNGLETLPLSQESRRIG